MAGSPSITLKVRERFRESPEFWLQALEDVGSVSYTASAPGYDEGTGTVALTPSGIEIAGPFGDGAPGFVTTPRGWPSKVTLRALRLDASGTPVERQLVRGGISVEVALTTSERSVGSLNTAKVSIPAANNTASCEFRPRGLGQTVLAVVQPAGFRTPASRSSLAVTVRAPGLAILDDMTIGQHLQMGGVLNLGEPAPEAGLDVNLKSGDPTKLLLAPGPADAGQPSITIKIPPGGRSATYYVQALGNSGTVTHTAAASGYLDRAGTLTLAPSGVIIMPATNGPPDEAELLRPESAGGHPTLMMASLSDQRQPLLTLYTAFMNPVSRRCADITVQQLRAGMEIYVDLQSTNPGVGRVDRRVVIKGGAERTAAVFTPVSVGETKISVSAPSGFALRSNATEILAVVKQ